MDLRGIITKLVRECTSLLILVWKKSRDLRIYADFCWLNAKTVKDARPLPRQADCLPAL